MKRAGFKDEPPGNIERAVLNDSPKWRHAPREIAAASGMRRRRGAILERLRADEQSLAVFSKLGAFFAITALPLVWPIAAALSADDLVSLVPIAIVATGLLLLALSSLGFALLLRATEPSPRSRRTDDSG
jgi:hypothetical protein